MMTVKLTCTPTYYMHLGIERFYNVTCTTKYRHVNDSAYKVSDRNIYNISQINLTMTK